MKSAQSSQANTDLISELGAVREAVEELYILLDHIWRNREELAGILEGRIDQLEIAETVAAVSHDAKEVSLGFCCENPQLVWEGDPDYPGIICQNCDFVAAENGSLVVRTEADFQTERKKQEQKELF